ncbi:apoptotic protease-activating factor 1-like [Leptidea sinapis]|uniref:apoptotic protease-activating factor 1-like n=1 Tax=Leptidea sinapis TaxID=189913 RepID=UPI00213CA6C7|nr:apoptotic protease-activating factor 1-like [Leptidea sinapis]XP_050674575.1 apoptotic protease-activating factor 1-like [Leptidea sinapis]
MDIKNRMLLQHHQQEIIKDLDVKFILDELFSRNAINNEDFDHIYTLSDRVERARYLLETLVQNGNNSAYEAFVDSLAKDYNWLWVKLALGNNKAMIEDSFEDSISRGDVPRLPDHFVRREAVENNVANKLKHLTRHKILALHGMSGSGKTCVAISVLRHNPELITNNFNGVIFWRNLGNCKTEDDIIAQQNKLYRRASSMCTHNSFMNSSVSMSSMGSNADSLSSYDWSWQELRDRLKSVFSEQTLKESLLVLDEVNEKKCLEAFDIGCKILVTTRDTDVVANFHPQIIKIENHFTEAESLSLFASCIDISESKLPRQAKKLHEICKGSPFHIALIGAELCENKERLVHDTRHWNYYLGKLERKDFFFLTRQNGNPMKTIEMCINSLKSDILPLFRMLTILPDGAKVSAKVLSKLWNKDVGRVESIMKHLRSKSLIIEFYDQEQRNYIYEIHDLIMNYLRSSSNEEDIKKIHGDFLKSYNYDMNTAPVEIEDDGYIAFYIGYHLLNTQNLNNRWGLFNKLFLNLKFLGNKVRLTGPADVILDLQKYENYIVEEELDKDLVYSIKGFLSTHGTDLYRYPCTDLVQSVLQHESRGILYTHAASIAAQRTTLNELYFDFLHEQNVEEIKHSTIDAKDVITTVCFLGNYVVVGTVTGALKFFHITTNKLKKELKCSDSSVKWVGASPVNPSRVASLSYDGVIKLCYIDDLEQEENEEIIEEEPEESITNFAINVTIQPKLGPFINCRWANKDEIIITHTSKMIILYTPSGKVLQVIDNLYRERDIMCCVPCNKDMHVIVATANSTHSLDIIDLKTKERHSVEETDTVLDIVTIPNTSKIITLKEKEITEFDCKLSGYLRQICTNCKHRMILSSANIKDSVCFLSVAVNKKGTLLFVSTDDSRIICVDIKTTSYLFDLENKRGNVVTMAVSEILTWDDFEPGPDVLLSGTGNIENSVKVWFLDASYVSQNTLKNGKARLTTKFDASFIHTATPNTPISNNTSHSTNNTPKRHQSFVNSKDVVKKVVKSTMSLDRHSLKPLNLKGICNGLMDNVAQPLLAVVDDKNNIQVMRGKKLLTEISTDVDEQITAIKISPCNQHIVFGLYSGVVRKYSMCTKETLDIMDVYSPVQYLNFVNTNLLIVAGKNRCLMAYKMGDEGWKSEMLQRGNCNLGSQEILNDLQGVKKKHQSDQLSNSSSELSVTSRLFSNGDTRERLCRPSNLVACYWVQEIGLVAIETNATIKLWDCELKLSSVLNGRQTDVYIKCSAFQKNILVICDDHNMAFQTLELKKRGGVSLSTIQESKLNNRIISCALTSDGNILAMGLDSGDVAVWNVPNKRQLRLLKHHKSKVQWCGFSPSPEKLFRSSASPSHASPTLDDDEQAPLVLVTMAAEIVWWNITYIIRMRPNRSYWRTGWNVVTPIASPLEPRSEISGDLNVDSTNFFFSSSLLTPHYQWKSNWRKKTCKEGSKRKEILACIKLSGMYAKKICHDDQFSCFVTVDHPGHAHIMSLMKTNC